MVTRALDDWRVNDLRNARVGTLFMDNDPAFTSREMHDYLTGHCISKSFSCAYHQHQNGTAEALWARLTPLTIIHLQSAPWLGTAFWPWAMCWANEQLVRRPSKANSDRQVPLDKYLQREPSMKHTAHLRTWGSVCYVHEQGAKGFQVKAKKGNLLGQSPNHAEGVYAIYMPDTKAIVHRMDVIFHEEATRIPQTMPGTLVFDMRTRRPDKPLGSCSGCKRLFAGSTEPDFQYPASRSGETAPVHKKGTEWPVNALVFAGDLSSSRCASHVARATALNGKTVEQALQMSYLKGSSLVPCKKADLRYDLKGACGYA